jgi:hypothetical protein
MKLEMENIIKLKLKWTYTYCYYHNSIIFNKQNGL